MITGLAHVGCSVSDLDAAMDFYNRDLGIEHGRTQLSDQPYLSDVNGLPDCRIRIGFALIEGDATPLEVLQYLNPPGRPTGAAVGRPGSPHLCWQVDDLDAALGRLQQAGLTLLGGPQTIEHGLWSGRSGAFLRGPGGVLTELIAEPDATGTGRLLRLHHVGYEVTSLETSLTFMVDVLGCRLESHASHDGAYYASAAGSSSAPLRSAFLTFPGSTCQLELLALDDPDETPADMANFNIGATHCCFMVDDIHATREAMLAQGVEFVGPPAEVTAGVNKGAFAIYFIGPDGLRFELFEGRSTSVAG